MHNPSAAYVHIPFCAAKCFYCDFNSYPGLERIYDDYVQAIRSEIERAQRSKELQTIYFGGGTPTVLGAEQLRDILRALYDTFPVAADAEITIEANPGTVDKSKLNALSAAGFNRLSLGVQVLDDNMLAKLGRIHSVQDALDAYSAARESGFDNISIDLMFALPGQKLSDWKKTLGSTMKLLPEHISLYELSIEQGTKFAKLYAKYLNTCPLPTHEMPDHLPVEDVKLEMYNAAIDILTEFEYEHYEVSNFARPGFRSRHNQVYWRNDAYYGFGAGAASYIEGMRCTNLKLPGEYIDSILRGGSSVDTCEQVSRETSMGETLMLALRTAQGLDRLRFKERYEVDALEVYPESVARLAAAGLVEIKPDSLRLTRKGLLIADEVAQEFLP